MHINIFSSSQAVSVNKTKSCAYVFRSIYCSNLLSEINHAENLLLSMMTISRNKT